ncbi:hypothetical protein BGX26_001316, partial [Mortierella sp. AD094]
MANNNNIPPFTDNTPLPAASSYYGPFNNEVDFIDNYYEDLFDDLGGAYDLFQGLPIDPVSISIHFPPVPDRAVNNHFVPCNGTCTELEEELEQTQETGTRNKNEM